MRKKLVTLVSLVLLMLFSASLTGIKASASDLYNDSTVYYCGNTVIYDGIEYQAKWYTVGVTPGTEGSAWERASEYDENGYPIWYDGMVVTGGSSVSYNGEIFTAKWWTTSLPGSDNSWTSYNPEGGNEPGEEPGGEIGSETGGETNPETGTGTYDITKVYFCGDKATYNGINYTAKYYTCGDIPGAAGGPWEREAEYDEFGLEVWYAGKVYTQGECAYHNDVLWEAKYWTNTEPGSDSSWKNLTNPEEEEENNGGGGQAGSNATVYSDYTVEDSLVAQGSNEFRVVGYFPFYSAYKADSIQYDCLTNIIYAFAFPDGNGGLQPLDDVALVERLITDAHTAGVEVQLGVGGWAYYGTIMEYQFDGCTSSPELIDQFTDAIVDLVNQYGFDGVDMDWEHPRFGTDSYQCYEDMMLMLRQKLGQDKLLTSAVLSGVTTDGTVYYDAAAHTANVMAVCNWFNIMAYDCECTLDFCQSCANYWSVTRGMPANKVCMGVPFYSYPSWISYEALLAQDASAATNDMEGTYYYHNGHSTLAAKVDWAEESSLAGIMIWELSQDTTDPSTSLLRAIYNAIDK